MEMCTMRIRIEALEDGRGKLTEKEIEEVKLGKCCTCPDNPDII
jgi:hypothetical protein